MDDGFVSQEYEVPEAGFGSLPESVHTKQLADLIKSSTCTTATITSTGGKVLSYRV